MDFRACRLFEVTEVVIDNHVAATNSIYNKKWTSNSYTMGCPPVRGDYPRDLASGLSYVQVDNIV